MAESTGRQPALPPLTVDVSPPVPVDTWAPLPAQGRIQVGGHTVWPSGAPPEGGIWIVAQPNRWGIVESQFPDGPCLVEADPEVTAHLPLPATVEGFVDRAHRPIPPPHAGTQGRELIEKTARLAKQLAQIPSVRLIDSPVARTIPFLTPLEAAQVTEGCRRLGVVGMRVLEGMGGAVALTVHSGHEERHLAKIAAVVGRVVGGAE